MWSDLAGQRIFIVADEADAKRLGEPRGSVYTADEVRRVCQITDSAIVREVHTWKREFNASVRDVEHKNYQGELL